MRRTNFNKYERVAGLFILVAVGGACLSAVSVAVKQGWFEPRSSYETTFDNAEGIHAGTTVKMAGLNAGAVDDVELLPDSKIKVTFHILGKFRNRVRQDSTTQLIRPFIIGDRVLEVTVGTEAAPIVAEHTQLQSEEGMDIMTLMSGKKMGVYMTKLAATMENLQILAEALTNRDRTESMVRIFDRLDPLLASLTSMSTEVVKLSKQATKDDSMGRVMKNAAILTEELNQILPALNKENPDMGKDLAVLTHSLGKVTREFDQAMAEMGPEAPKTARRAIEALNETTVLIKALQKSLLLRGSVREVREEEAKEGEQRMPAKAPDAP